MINSVMKNKVGSLHKITSIICVIFLSGCYQPEKLPRIVQETPKIESDSEMRNKGFWVAGHSVQGRPILVQTLGKGAETILLMATIHGNEPAGTPLLRQLSDYLQQRPSILEGRRVVLINIANPDGWVANTRCNANGVDLNRNFTTTNRINNNTYGNHGLSEPEAVVLKNIILRYRPQRIVSIHQPLECIDYDGSGESLAHKMAAQCHLPVKKLGARPGSLGSYAGVTLGIPIITFEMVKSDTNLSGSQLWKLYGRALLAAIEG